MPMLPRKHAIVAGLTAVIFTTAISTQSGGDLRASAFTDLMKSFFGTSWREPVQTVRPAAPSPKTPVQRNPATMPWLQRSIPVPQGGIPLFPLGETRQTSTVPALTVSASSLGGGSSAATGPFRRCEELDANRNTGGGNRVTYVDANGNQAGEPVETLEHCITGGDHPAVGELFCIPHGPQADCWNAYYQSIGASVTPADAENDGIASLTEA